MKYYKDENNQVYAYESDGSQDEFIPESYIAITEEEAIELTKPPVIPPTAEENKATASKLLLDTDWVELPSVSDTSEPTYLTNKAEFMTYRSAVRAIALDPTTGDLIWPVKPTTVWSS